MKRDPNLMSIEELFEALTGNLGASGYAARSGDDMGNAKRQREGLIAIYNKQFGTGKKEEPEKDKVAPVPKQQAVLKWREE